MPGSRSVQVGVNLEHASSVTTHSSSARTAYGRAARWLKVPHAVQASPKVAGRAQRRRLGHKDPGRPAAPLDALVHNHSAKPRRQVAREPHGAGGVYLHPTCPGRQ
eukprot:3595194-Prymnesium_polylepis.1